MGSRRSPNHRPKRIDLSKIIIWCSVAILSIPTVSAAIENTHWIQFGKSCKSLADVQARINRLPADLRGKVTVCVTDAEYALVHSAYGSPSQLKSFRLKLEEKIKALQTLDTAFRADEVSSSDYDISVTVVKYPKKKCFNANQFLKNPDNMRFVKPKPRPSEPPVRVQLPAVLTSKKRTQMRKKSKPNIPARNNQVLNNTTVKVLPELTTRVFLSNRDTNRLTCLGGRLVKDVITSEEKGITKKILGSNAFIKFKVRQDPATLAVTEYLTEPTEIYVVCHPENAVYTLIGIPKKIPAQTVQLATKADRVRTNLSLFEGMPLEQKIIEIMRHAYRGEYPDSYTVKPVKRQIALSIVPGADDLHEGYVKTKYSALKIEQTRLVEIEGEGFRLKEYSLGLSRNFPVNEIAVNEKQFILPELTDKPVAITLDALSVSKNRMTRLFILEKNEVSDS